ncbi:Peptidase S46 [Candidatus Ornithobacterium hominis]|uniref:S46 family peptidase n=1 Tax=Candidatus Ornithobacterium hominis TaxID=2497989 RepID=UPI000E5BA81E|nr:S46 family peptidase [Candidatus Ornithobacterium hominis]SZD73275.1 Peptidase S46 [Candidatus Ornithobacterium hominis]
MNFKFSTLLIFVGSFLFAQTGGGMWIPTELNEKEMKKMGMNISAKDIFNSQKASIKDAIAHFGGGCTSEVISPQGLLLTNHHCGYSQIQSHSTLQNNYLQDGFWAKSMSDELANPGLTATFIIDIKEVTNEVLIGENMTESAIKENIKTIVNKTKKENWQEAFVKPFYKGNKYYLFITETYRDVRLVGAPPSSIGKFGSDTDNWVWPRHTGDFSLFRIYADKNNRPAEYSPENIPYKPKHFLPINIKGLEKNDFTFVFGFPGLTDEYLPASAIEQTVKTLNPAKVEVRDEALKIMDAYMKQDQNIKIKYASKYASIANYWKNMIGVNQGIQKSGAIQIKRDYEQRLLNKIREKCKTEKSERCVQYPSMIEDLNQLYQKIEHYNLAKAYFDEAIYRNSETFRIALTLSDLSKNEGQVSHELRNRVSDYLKSLYKDYEPQVDKDVSLAVWNLYKKNVPAEFQPDNTNITAEDLDTSIITGGRKINQISLIENPKLFLSQENLKEILNADPLIQKIRAIESAYSAKASPKRISLQNKIDDLLKKYMKAQMDFMQDEKKFFPDANSTLRVTYGKVNGYAPRDAVYYDNTTYLKGVMEKYVPGDYEFDVPEKLRSLYAKKDYGVYAKNGKMPVNFIATNHTTGGNSGSPALDADGNLVGLNFDRVWEGTMSDLYYDPEISRNIMVDARYILFIIDKYANADRLIKEMKLVK